MLNIADIENVTYEGLFGKMSKELFERFMANPEVKARIEDWRDTGVHPTERVMENSPLYQGSPYDEIREREQQ